MHEAWQGDFALAAAALSETADKAAIADARLAGWHNLWLGWFYQLAGDEGAASAEYTRARSRLGGAVFLPRPRSLTIEGHRMTLRGSRMSDLLSEPHSSRFEKEMGIIGKRFAPLSAPGSTAAQHEEATRALGEALGFAASRPDNSFRTGPDVLWIDEEEKTCLLFELKTLQEGTKPLTKKIVGQGHDHVQWVKHKHSELRIAGLIFVAESERCYGDANPSETMWIGSLRLIQSIADDFIVQMRTIRNALPLERLIKASAYAADPQHGIDGLRDRIAVCRVKGDVS